MHEKTPASAPEHDQGTQDDQWLDEALSQTFPASDPIPFRHKQRDPESEEKTAR
jgi:hypothetical protein